MIYRDIMEGRAGVCGGTAAVKAISTDARILAEARVFRADGLVGLWQDAPSTLDSARDCVRSVARAPFPICWYEAKIPGMRVAALVEKLPGPDMEHVKVIALWQASLDIGRVHAFAIAPEGVVEDSKYNKDFYEKTEHLTFVWHIIGLAWIAWAFMLTANPPIREDVMPLRCLDRPGSNGKPRVRGQKPFHWITVPGGHPSGNFGSGAGHECRAHMVRGHFKCVMYQGRRQLRWWPWHVRGNPDRGWVDAGYNLAATHEGANA